MRSDDFASFIVAANVPKCVYFEATVSVVSIIVADFIPVDDDALVVVVAAAAVVVKVYRTRSQLLRSRQLNTMLNSPSRRNTLKMCKRN